MDARWMFLLLAAGFGVAAFVRWRRARRIDPAVRTWGLLAFIFGTVSAWLTVTFVH